MALLVSTNLILHWLQRFYLEEVELIIVEDPVIIQVRHFEDARQGFHTEGLHLSRG